MNNEQKEKTPKNQKNTVFICLTACILTIALVLVFVFPLFSNNQTTMPTQPTEQTKPTSSNNEPTAPTETIEPTSPDCYLAGLVPTNSKAKSYPFKKDIFPINNEYFSNTNSEKQYQFIPSDTYRSAHNIANSSFLMIEGTWDKIAEWPISYIYSLGDARSLHVVSSSGRPNGILTFSQSADDDMTIGNAIINGHWTYVATDLDLTQDLFFVDKQDDFIVAIVEQWGMPTKMQYNCTAFGNSMYTMEYLTEDCLIAMSVYEQVANSSNKGMLGILIIGNGAMEFDTLK